MAIFRKKEQDLQKELINRCIKNDRKAQLIVYNKYAKAMYSLALHMIHQKEQAEDLMQDSFISMFNNLKDFKGDVSLGAWLKKIVINKCLDYLKKKKINFEQIDSDHYIIPDQQNELSFSHLGTIEEIKKEINLLSDGYQTIMNLYLYEGYDHEEIGQILGISASTSRSQYARGKQIIREKLKKKQNNG